MDLVRLILLKIEEEYVSTALYNIEIDGYDKETIAYHCKILHEAGFVSDYGSRSAAYWRRDYVPDGKKTK